MGEWISVKDRLPAIYKPVHIYMPDCAPEYRIETARMTGVGEFYCSAGKIIQKITHWCELINAPGEER